MAAGLGSKTFATGDVLSATDVNGYLMQGVLVFASAAARDAAITAPAEGQVCYLKDTDQVLSYSGSTWVAVGGGSPLTTKGDLYTFSTVDARVGVGANDTVLTADSSTATGLKWAAPAASGGANFTLLNSGGTALTGAATITVSGISGADKILVLVDTVSAGAGSDISLRFNANSSSVYYRTGLAVSAPSAYSVGNVGGVGTASNATATSLILAIQSSDADATTSGFCLMNGCNASGVKAYNSAGGASAATGNGQFGFVLGGFFNSSATISSVSVISGSGNFDSGTIFVYTSA